MFSLKNQIVVYALEAILSMLQYLILLLLLTAWAIFNQIGMSVFE